MGLTTDDATLYHKLAGELTAFATGLVGPGDAPDVVTEAFLRCVHSRRWASVVDQRAYLFKAVVSEARMHHRSTMRRRARELRAARLDPLDDGLSDTSVDPSVLDALGRLSVRQRAVVVLAY